MKIVFEKWYKGERLDSWARVFNNTDELMEYMNNAKGNLLGLDETCYITIRQVKEYKVGE